MILNKKKLTKELTNLQSKQVCEGGHGHSLDLSHVGAALAVRYIEDIIKKDLMKSIELEFWTIC